MSKRGFEELLLEAVDEALSSLGGSLRQETYLQLEESFNVKRHEIPYKTDAFAKAIGQIFGSKVINIEILILRRLYEKVGATFKPEESEFSFNEHLRQARGRLYEAFVNSMKSGFAVFYFENVKDLSSFRLIAANSSAAQLSREAAEKLVGKDIADVYPEILKAQVSKIVEEVIVSGKAKTLGHFYFGTEDDPRNHFSAAIFPLSNNCVGIAFKNFVEPKQTDKSALETKPQSQDTRAGMGDWRWEPDAQWRQIYASRLRARELWIRKKITRHPGRAEYLSIRGRECLETGAPAKARKLLREAEEIYRTFNRMDEAFENASLSVSSYLVDEENVNLEEYFGAAEEYFQKYRNFSTHESFLENLARYCQWQAYRHSTGNEFDNARVSYSKAEELFLSQKKIEDALFNASRRILTYKKESKMEEFLKPAEAFFDRYKELSANRYYKEIRAHYFSYKANQSGDFVKSIELLNVAENLFLEINQREQAFENACKKIDLYWTDISYYNEQSVEKCLEATERFFETYQDFSEHQESRKRLSKYYLYQIRVLTSQLKKSWH